MIGYEVNRRRQPSRAIRVRLEVFLVAALIVLMAFPAFGMVKKATHSMDCVRSAFQSTAPSCPAP
jgi:hypothetical protein